MKQFYPRLQRGKHCGALFGCALLVACGGEPASPRVDPVEVAISSAVVHAQESVLSKAPSAPTALFTSPAHKTHADRSLDSLPDSHPMAADLIAGSNGQVWHWAKHVLMPQVDVQVASTSGTSLVQTSELGVYALPAIAIDQSYQISAAKASRTADMDAAITSADALAALKIAVGLNPNPDPDGSGPQRALPVSPYQLMAADINVDGRVSSGDALAILKIAVGLNDAPPPYWRFVDEVVALWENHATKDAVYGGDGASIWQPFSGASAPNFVGVLAGDVNASWVSPDAVDVLPATYFEALNELTHTPLSVWLLRDARDISAPVIELAGPASIELAFGEAFVDPGASVIDDRDATVFVSVSGVVGSDPGVYTLVYSAADLSGNVVQLTRDVRVLEPLITAPTAQALSQMMGLGFNIGQVFESTDKAREFAPVKAKIDAYYALGFRTIRVPITWSNPIGGTTLIQDMTTGAVDTQHPRLGVIKAVVDYALSLPDTVVIINAHHEEPIKTQQLWWVFEKLWADIATIFKDRDKRLIFELLNEPHDVNGAAMPAPMLRSMSRLAYAQIRAIDPERVVVISGNQWASSNELALVWTDLAGVGEGLDPYVMATFHHYDPWTQFHSEDSPDKAYSFDVNTIENPMRQAQQWQTTIGANMPIYIGEWGVGWGKQWSVMDCNNVRRWYALFPQSAQTFGMPTQVWDDGGWFGVFDYTSGTFKNNLAQCITGDCEWSGTERFNSACYP